MISSGYDYAAEKLFYRAVKTNKRLMVNPDIAPPKSLAYVEGNLRKILDRYKDSRVAKEAHLALAEFYVNNEEYSQALPLLYDIINMYTQDRNVLSQAHFLRGLSFEKQDQWEKALREYTILRDEYTETALALRIPIYLGDYYRGKEEHVQANKAYNQAAQFYKEIEQGNKGEMRGYAAANLLIQVYLNLEQHEQAGKIVENTINNYPQLPALVQQLSNLELIFIKELNKPEKAIEIYRNIKSKTDNPQLTGFIDEKIKALEAQK